MIYELDASVDDSNKGWEILIKTKEKKLMSSQLPYKLNCPRAPIRLKIGNLEYQAWLNSTNRYWISPDLYTPDGSAFKLVDVLKAIPIAAKISVQLIVSEEFIFLLKQ